MRRSGSRTFFLVPQINWKPKSENIKTIAQTLNIGLDTFAFIDDNSFELNEVASTISEVTCINVEDIEQLWNGERFQGSNTEDSKTRRSYYQDAIEVHNTQVNVCFTVDTESSMGGAWGHPERRPFDAQRHVVLLHWQRGLWRSVAGAHHAGVWLSRDILR